MISRAGRQRLSLINHMSGASIQSVSSEATNWPAINLLDTRAPLFPWRTTATTAQNVVINIGTGKTYGFLALINANFAVCEVALDTGTDFSPASFPTVTLEVGLDNYSERRARGYELPAPRTEQYVRISIPAQTPTDGASYFSLGAVHLGPLVPIPRLEMEEEIEKVDPEEWLTAPSHASQRLILGDPYVRITYSRIALMRRESRGTNDDLEAWAEIDRLIRAARVFAWYPNNGNSAHCWIMQAENQRRYSLDPIVSRTPLILREIVG